MKLTAVNLMTMFTNMSQILKMRLMLLMKNLPIRMRITTTEKFPKINITISAKNTMRMTVSVKH